MCRKLALSGGKNSGHAFGLVKCVHTWGQCTCEWRFPPGLCLTILGQDVSPRFSRQVVPTTAADTFKIVLLGDEVSFDCAVESADVTEVSIWWQKDEANLTVADTEKYSLKVSRTVRLNKLNTQYVCRLTRQAREWCRAS
jgi:hypothetical protein